jgi:transcription antitermination factor NusG
MHATTTLMDNEAFRRLALEKAAQNAERIGPKDAELVPDISGRWYILTTMPNHEGIAAGHLIARRFGVFHPQAYVKYVTRGRKREVMRNLFPGYLFVFVWDIERHMRRLLSVPGVNGLVTNQDRPIVVPDRIINRVRAVENSKQRPLTYLDDVIVRRRRRKKYSQTVVRKEVTVEPNEIVAVHAYDGWDNIGELAVEDRIGKLHAALGLAS